MIPREQLGDLLATINACLNASCALALGAGRLAIVKRRVVVHRRLMITAFSLSVVFLISYLTRFALTGSHRYPGHGAAKLVYLTILFSHMALAAATPPLAIRALQLALTARIEAHRRIVRWAFPVWMYVSVTGVVVYWMLYHA
jgi:putative membrane protein